MEDKILQFLNRCWIWLADENNRDRVVAIAAVATVLIALAGILIRTRKIRTSPDGEVSMSEKTLRTMRKNQRQELIEGLERANGEERIRLENELKEINRQLADVESAHVDALSKIRELEAALARLGRDIGDDRLAEIRAAMAAGDFSKADALLAEIEEGTKTAVVRAAEAAYQRGEISALQIRWDEAATHFDKAARLDPTYDRLMEAGKYSKLTAQYGTALRHFEKLLELSPLRVRREIAQN